MSLSLDAAALLARARRDPYYRDLMLEGPSVLRAAGCFVESVQADIRTMPCLDVRIPTTAVSKVRNALTVAGSVELRTPVVLLSTGCFSPVHQGHLSMMEAARKTLERQGHWVVGGYLSAAHDEYASSKTRGTTAMPVEQRLAWMEEAVQDSAWLHVCPWEGRYTPCALNFTDVLDHLQAYLRHHLQKPFQVAYVFGSDNVGFVEAFRNQGLAVCVQRGEVSLLQAQLQLLCGRDNSRRSRILWASRTEHLHASSTRVRAGELEHLPPTVHESFARFRVPPGPGVDNSHSALYLVRQDAAHGTSIWPDVPAQGVESFHAKLRELLEPVAQSMGQEFQFVNLLQQQEMAQDLEATHQVLSLDACVPGAAQLKFSRLFELCDGQVRASQMAARPDAAQLGEQLAQLRAGPGTRWLVLDDDSSTGATRTFVKKLLEERGFGIERFIFLNEAWLKQQGLAHRAIADIVDARDFLVGARDAGLVVRLLDGRVARAPYMLPFVQLMFRAKLPATSVQELSTRLWELNHWWFARFAPSVRVRHAAQASQLLLQSLGFTEGAFMHEVCERMGSWMRSSVADLQPRALHPLDAVQEDVRSKDAESNYARSTACTGA